MKKIIITVVALCAIIVAGYFLITSNYSSMTKTWIIIGTVLLGLYILALREIDKITGEMEDLYTLETEENKFLRELFSDHKKK